MSQSLVGDRTCLMSATRFAPTSTVAKPTTIGGGDNWLIINTLHDLALRFMSLIVGLSVAKIQQNHVTAK